MLRSLVFLLTGLAAGNIVPAQECSAGNVESLPGKWKPGAKGASDHAAADMVKEKAIMEEVLQFVRTQLKWSPVGGDITYNIIYSINGQDYRPKPMINTSNSYYAGLYFQHYFCADGKIAKEDYSIDLRVQFNKLPFDFSESFFVTAKNKDGYDIERDPGNDVYGFVESLPAEKKGQFDIDGGAGKAFRYRCRTLTKYGKLPYVIMSKKEYYEKWRKKHGKAIEALRQNIADIAKQEQELGNYEVSKTCKQAISLYTNYIKQIDAILQTRSAEELAKPAFGGEENGQYYNAGTKENPKSYIIKPDYTYYSSGLPRYSPQTISIFLQYAVAADSSGNERPKDYIFYRALEDSRITDLLTQKLRLLITR